MVQTSIKPLTKPFRKTLSIPGSKSYTNRALILAALTEGEVTIINPLFSDDTKVMINCLQVLGIKIVVKMKKITVIGSIKDVKEKYYELNANLSGTTIRFILALSTILPGTKKIYGEASLNARPIGELVLALRQLGAEIEYCKKEGYAPVLVKSVKLNPGITKMHGDISSQYFSAILMIAPLVGKVIINVIGKQISKPYIDMTIDSMRKFGVQTINQGYKKYLIPDNQKYLTREYLVEGDFSSAGYFLAIATLTCSKLVLKNLDPKSKQADKNLINILKRMGNKIDYGEDYIIITGKGVKAMNINMRNCPDQVQTVAVLSAFAPGKTTISGIKSLRIKETERVIALEKELGKMGIKTKSTRDTINIYGGNPHSATIDTYNDHRMVMSFAVAGTKLDGMVINNPEVVSKTFPDFWLSLKAIGVTTRKT